MASVAGTLMRRLSYSTPSARTMNVTVVGMGSFYGSQDDPGAASWQFQDG